MNRRGRGGNFRGRGARGAGGRGRRRGSSRFGPARRFDGGRLADKEPEEAEEAESGSDDETKDDLVSIASGDDEDEEQPSRPYAALLQSFSEAAAPKAKRRKLEHNTSPPPVASGSAPHQSEDDDEARHDDVDRVEEEEEEEEREDGGLDEQPDDGSDSEMEDDSLDPFDRHFAHPDEASVAKAIEAVKKGQWATKRGLIQPLRATLTFPGSEVDFDFSAPAPQLENLRLKQKLKETAGRKMGKLDESQRALAPLLFGYRDVLHCDRTVANANSLRQLVCLHALNHVFKTRDRIIKNNYKLAKEGEDTELEFRDQGFTRPKVLFLLPTRNSCARVMSAIRELCEPDQQENRKRFEESYVQASASFGSDRPADFRDLFEGNDDDMFRIGVKFTRKTIKYFSPFYSSDLLLASPLGLRMAMGSEDDKKPDADFLSSIELVVVDEADALLMQNWEHVEHIFEHLNRQPKDAHGCDFSRVRSWYLEDWAGLFRQTVVLSAFNTPELSELLRRHGRNWAGRARLQPEYAGAIERLGVRARQTFSRFQAASAAQDPDGRFEYFVAAVVPALARRAAHAPGTLLFVPSYLDFVRVRNYLAGAAAVAGVSFGAVSEYTAVPEASRARSHFSAGRHRLLVYTERAHHFRRYRLRGVRRVVFYGLPDNPVFYRELAGGFLASSEQDGGIGAGQGAVRVLFSRFDAMKLERVVGSGRVARMMGDRGDTFDFV